MSKFINQNVLSTKVVTQLHAAIKPHLDLYLDCCGREGDWHYDMLEPVAIQETDDVFVGFQVDLDGIPLMMLPTGVDAAAAGVHLQTIRDEVNKLLAGAETIPSLRVLDADENSLAFGVVVTTN